jgi:hypothetical protein
VANPVGNVSAFHREMNERIMQAVVNLSTAGSSKAQNTRIWLDARQVAIACHAIGTALMLNRDPAGSIAGRATVRRRPFG